MNRRPHPGSGLERCSRSLQHHKHSSQFQALPFSRTCAQQLISAEAAQLSGEWSYGCSCEPLNASTLQLAAKAVGAVFIAVKGEALLRLDRITRDQADVLALPGSPQNANRALRTLRRMLGKAAEWGLIRNPPRIKLRKEYGRDLIIDHASQARLLARPRQPLKDVLLLSWTTACARAKRSA